MSLAGLLAAVAEDPQLRTALAAQPETVGERDIVAPAALRPLLSAALATGAAGADAAHAGGRFVLAVTATAREADDLTAALRAFLPPQSVATFPGWETLPHERLSPRSDTVGQRIAVLRRLQHPEIPGQDAEIPGQHPEIPGEESGPATAAAGNAPGAEGAGPRLRPGEGALGEG
ncbi:MAG TPA: hypothetical protein VHF26_03050, partial [Trebonia sp.]|nr:hypothetical protein [Trebonia sp.]